jgi:hypothetical protein
LVAVLWKAANGEAGWVDISLALVAFIPGLGDVGKNADKLDEASEVLQGVVKGLDDIPAGTLDELTGLLGKSPELMAAVSKNPDALADLLKRGDEGMALLTQLGENPAMLSRLLEQGGDLTKLGDEAAGLLAQYGDDAARILEEGGSLETLRQYDALLKQHGAQGLTMQMLMEDPSLLRGQLTEDDLKFLGQLSEQLDEPLIVTGGRSETMLGRLNRERATQMLDELKAQGVPDDQIYQQIYDELGVPRWRVGGGTGKPEFDYFIKGSDLSDEAKLSIWERYGRPQGKSFDEFEFDNWSNLPTSPYREVDPGGLVFYKGQFQGRNQLTEWQIEGLDMVADYGEAGDEVLPFVGRQAGSVDLDSLPAGYGHPYYNSNGTLVIPRKPGIAAGDVYPPLSVSDDGIIFVPGRQSNRLGLSATAKETTQIAEGATATVQDLLDEGARPLLENERPLAEYLAAEGHSIKTLPEGGARRGGDILLDDASPVEIKSIDPGATDATIRNTVNNSVRRGGQARDIIIDARGSGLTLEQAQQGLKRAGGITRGRVDSVRIIGDGFDTISTDFK